LRIQFTSKGHKIKLKTENILLYNDYSCEKKYYVQELYLLDSLLFFHNLLAESKLWITFAQPESRPMKKIIFSCQMFKFMSYVFQNQCIRFSNKHLFKLTIF
jgi:hypothetical protein